LTEYGMLVPVTLRLVMVAVTLLTYSTHYHDCMHHVCHFHKAGTFRGIR